MIFDYLFVGSGVATLASANCLIDAGNENFLILEQGSLLNRRGCPGVKRHTCVYCQPGCHIVEGVGGSNALFGNKMCYFPSSSGILGAFPREILHDAFNYLEHFLSPYFDRRHITDSRTFVEQKEYYSDVLSQRQFADMVNRLTARLRSHHLKCHTVVSEIRKADSDLFVVTTRANEVFHARAVVLATGRSSHSWLRKVFRNLDIEYMELRPDVGIRVEADFENFTGEYYYQVDPKFKFEFPPYGTARTFCAHNRGVVVPVAFGSGFYADGAFPARFTKNNNIALMTRAAEAITVTDLETWCAQINRFSSDNLVLGDVTLRRDLDPITLSKEIMALVPLWPLPANGQLMEQLLTKLFSPPYGILKCSNSGSNKLRVYAPAIDHFWPRPKLDSNLQSKCPGLSVLGDATGLSRGYVQAMTSGAAWALAQISRTRTVEVQKKWSALV